jgi:hypothetical protein
LCKKRGCNFDFPPPLLYFYYSAYDEIADFWAITGAEGDNGEEFIGFQNCAENGGMDCSGVLGMICAVASAEV